MSEGISHHQMSSSYSLFHSQVDSQKSLIRKCLLTIFQLEIVGHSRAHERCMFGAFNPFIDAC